MNILVVQDIVDNKKLQMRGIIGLYAANAVGDDIEVYKDDSRAEVLCRWVHLCTSQQWLHCGTCSMCKDCLSLREGLGSMPTCPIRVPKFVKG